MCRASPLSSSLSSVRESLSPPKVNEKKVASVSGTLLRMKKIALLKKP